MHLPPVISKTDMSYSLNSLQGIIEGTSLSGSLDYSSYCFGPRH